MVRDGEGYEVRHVKWEMGNGSRLWVVGYMVLGIGVRRGPYGHLVFLGADHIGTGQL